MKIAVALFFCIALPATLAMFDARIMDDLLKIEEDCSKESGVTFDEIEVVRKNKAVPDNEKMNKWAMCMMKKHNVMNKDGTVNMDKNSIQIPADTDSVLRSFEQCKSRTGRDKDDTARQMMNCYMQNNELVISWIKRKNT